MIQNNPTIALADAKANKVIELKADLQTFRDLGFVDNGWTFNLSEQSANYVKAKNDATWSGGDRYKYSDKAYIQRNFTDNAGFDPFAQNITAEEDRIMVIYNNYRLEIKDCTTVAEVDAINISFTA